MLLVINLKDGALGYTASDSAGYAIIGVAQSGTVNQLIGLQDPQKAYDTWTGGKLADRCAYQLTQGKGPVYGMRAAASNAGSMPNYQRQLTATIAANAGGAAFGSLVQPGSPRNVEIVFAAGWDGGNVTIVGVSPSGAAITETITAAAGSTVKGLRVYASITSISKGAVGATANTAQAFSGNKSAEGGNTTDAEIASTGSTPLDDLDLVIQMTRPGNTAGPSYPAFRASFDGGNTFGAEIALSGATYTGFMAQYGITLVFSGATVLAGDEFRFGSAGPTSTTGDLSAALAALAADPRQWEALYICGAISGAQAAVVESWVAAQRAAGRYFWVLCEARDIAYQGGTETEAAWMTSILADFAGFTSTYGQVSVVAGGAETVLPGPRGVERRSLAWSIGAKISSVPLSVHPGQPLDAGPLTGLYKPANDPGIYHDERTSPGLGGTTGRFLTAQTLLGQPLGAFFVGDAAGKRSPGTMAGPTSDYSLLMNVRVMMLTCRVLLEAGSRVLARKLATKRADGTLLTSEADKIDAEMTQYLVQRIVSPGHAVSARSEVSRTEPVYSSKRLPFQAFIKTYAYGLEVDITAGFEALNAAVRAAA